MSGEPRVRAGRRASGGTFWQAAGRGFNHEFLATMVTCAIQSEFHISLPAIASAIRMQNGAWPVAKKR
jgi:hypothetical protein